jgi:hypothetical protein
MLFKNTNIDAKNSNNHKDKFEQNLAGVMQYNMELPLKKENSEFINNFTPKVALMYSPNKSKNLSSDNRRMDTSNIYSLNRIANNEIVLQNEYRQENKNSSHIADFSIASSDFLASKNTTKTHFFSNSKFELNNDFFNLSNFEINLENVTNDEYLKVYKINGEQIDIETNTLHSFLSLNTEKNDIEFYTSLEIYEDLTKDKQSRHEFIYPNYTLQKRILTEKGNDFVLKSYGSQRKYNTNIYEGIIIKQIKRLIKIL